MSDWWCLPWLSYVLMCSMRRCLFGVCLLWLHSIGLAFWYIPISERMCVRDQCSWAHLCRLPMPYSECTEPYVIRHDEWLKCVRGLTKNLKPNYLRHIIFAIVTPLNGAIIKHQMHVSSCKCDCEWKRENPNEKEDCISKCLWRNVFCDYNFIFIENFYSNIYRNACGSYYGAWVLIANA